MEWYIYVLSNFLKIFRNCLNGFLTRDLLHIWLLFFFVSRICGHQIFFQIRAVYRAYVADALGLKPIMLVFLSSAQNRWKLLLCVSAGQVYMDSLTYRSDLILSPSTVKPSIPTPSTIKTMQNEFLSRFESGFH